MVKARLRSSAILCLVLLLLIMTFVACNPEEAKRYTVTFMNGDEVYQTQTVKEGETAIEINDPTKTGYIFKGWYLSLEDETSFSFSTPITSDVTLYAKWEEVLTEQMTGSGTQEDPYVIKAPIQLMNFSEKVNSDPAYASAFYRLDADLDMTGLVFTPAGASSEEGGAFSGVFDGNNHKISNLAVESVIRKGQAYLGLFGETYMANIENLTLENISYRVESYSSDNTISAHVGGVAGYAQLTNFQNINVSGTIYSNLLAENSAYIGGLAGELDIYSNEQAYILYVENCNVNVEMIVDEEGSLEGDVVGGLLGYIKNYNSAAAIVNCKTDGYILGGQYTGGLVGYITDYISIINCASTAKVEATSVEVSYAGGLVGMSSGNSIIMDSFSTGRVKAPQSTGSYKSYVGGIIGYSTQDDYVYYYAPGTGIVNCYSSGTLSGGDIKNSYGNKVEASEITKSWILDTLKWDERIWVFGNESQFDASCYPSETLASDVQSSYSVVLKDGADTVLTLDKAVSGHSYSLLGELESAENKPNLVFWDWEFQRDEEYRFYIPVVKDMTLNAYFCDVTGIAKSYNGKGTLLQTVFDSGIIVFNTDGTMQWFSETASSGTYRFDGEHFIFYNDSVGEVSGTIKNGVMEFTMDAGMTGDVLYRLEEYEMDVLGEYVANSGDIFTVYGEDSVSFQSSGLNDGQTIPGTFVKEGETYRINGGKLAGYFQSFTFTLNADGSLTVNATANATHQYEIDAMKFSHMLSVDYSDAPFIGSYNLTVVSVSSDPTEPVNSSYALIFNSDGTAIYRSAFGDTNAKYYYFEDLGIIKLILSGYISTFTVDVEDNVIYGTLNRGVYSLFPVLLTSSEDGELIGYSINDKQHLVFRNDVGSFYLENAQYVKDAEISGTFEVGSRVTIQGKEYIVGKYEGYKDTWGYPLFLVGDEEGSYTLDGNTYTLDGIGNVTGSETGKYYVYGDNIVILLESDKLILFNYVEAKQSGTITPLEGDGYQGVWYLPGISEDEEGQSYNDPKRYKFVVDGLGHTTVFYRSGGEYRFNWGHIWGSYTITATGIDCKFNDVQFASVQFYYDRNLAYSKSFGYMEEVSFVKDGYTGSLLPPALPSQYVGSYKAVLEEGAVVLNLRGDLTGSFKGLPFVAVYDGDKTVSFAINDVQYTIVFGETIVLKFGETETTLTPNGVISEVIPSALAGTWTGDLYLGGSLISNVTVTIETDGTINYDGTLLANVQFDSESSCIFAQSGDNSFEFQWNWEEETLSLTVKDSENRETTATLVKK